MCWRCVHEENATRGVPFEERLRESRQRSEMEQFQRSEERQRRDEGRDYYDPYVGYVAFTD